MADAKTFILQLIADEQEAFHDARASGDRARAWDALTTIHILAQPYLVPHWLSHIAMLRYAVQERDWREVGGQILRLALVPLGNATGRLPVGNHGRARVSPFRPMPISEHIAAKLASSSAALPRLRRHDRQ